ncbi:integrase [Shewanella sp. NFH-SH190041]|uniref:tyrosine-type recombinase/integrase n=1 Tax=Shewanella sp. NFH-SH190041 TaxID=2950245 RepID=UPI0021C3515C|nr:tyrosine-type recombinase/integrase [Shewanella sp. NFH-SH190041]BDM64346.1 integrase [Shewanella sp. NFH-SH190041]
MSQSRYLAKQAPQPQVPDQYYSEQNLPASILSDFQQAAAETEFEVTANTRRSYQTSFAIFQGYCEHHGINALPADPRAVISFIGQQKELFQENGCQLSRQTLTTRLAAIRHYHIEAGFKSPTDHPMLLRIMRGLSRNHYRVQADYDQQPIMYHELAMLLECVDKQKHPLLACRDRALLTLGFQGGFRRSELAGMQVQHVSFLRDKLRVRLPYSKSNQAGQKEWKDLPFAEPMACGEFIKAWLDISQITSGHLFRSISRDGQQLRPYQLKDATDPASRNSGFLNGDDVYRTVRKYCKQAGLGEQWFGAHSLRSGCVTQLHENDKDTLYIMGRTGHTDPRSLRHYLKPK